MEQTIKAVPYELLKPYEGKWVALDEDMQRIISSGGTFEETSENTPKEKKVTYMRVLPFDISFAPNALRIS
jgi:hypothetical protein